MSIKPEPKDEVPKFPLGEIVITQNARRTLTEADAFGALLRHASSDWGLVDTTDRVENDAALESGGRLVSIYRSNTGVKFYVITEGDRSATTVLLPEDY